MSRHRSLTPRLHSICLSSWAASDGKREAVVRGRWACLTKRTATHDADRPITPKGSDQTGVGLGGDLAARRPRAHAAANARRPHSGRPHLARRPAATEGRGAREVAEERPREVRRNRRGAPRTETEAPPQIEAADARSEKREDALAAMVEAIKAAARSASTR